MTTRRARLVRRHATTLVLVAAALGAGLWLMIGERGVATTAEQQARRQNLLTQWRGDDLTRVTLVSLHGAAALVREHPEDRDDRSFRIEQGGRVFRADPQEVDRLLASLELATVRREVPPASVDRVAMGLDAPALRMTVEMGPVTHRLALGSTAPGDGTYVEVEGRGVFVVASSLAQALDVRAETLRDRTIAPVPSSGLAAIVLEGEGGSRRLERASWPASRGGGFRLGGGGPRASATAVEAMLQALGSLRAEVFLGEDAASLEEPRLTLTLEARDGPRAVIAIGGACPEQPERVVVRRTEPTRLDACAPAEVLPPLLKPRAELEDPRLIGASRDEIVEVRVARGTKVVEMARKGAGFFVRAPEEKDVPETAARAFLDALAAARGTLEAGAEAKLDGAGSAEVRVVSRPAAPGDPERVEALRIGPPEDGRRWVRREEDGATLVVEEDALRAVLAPELVLRERAVIDVAPEKVREVAVRGSGLDQRIRRAGLGLLLVTPRGPGLGADETWGLELLEKVARLSAVRWVSERADPRFGLDPPRFTIEMSIESDGPGTEATRTLRFGTPTDDGPYAQLAGEEAVFLAPPALEEAALRWLIDRGAFRVQPAKVARVVLLAEGAPPLTLVRSDGALIASGPDAPADAAARAARAREGLDELVALEAVAIGAGGPEHGLDRPVVELEVTPVEGMPFRLVVGASDAREGESISYARRSDVDAVFAVGRSGVRALREAVR